MDIDALAELETKKQDGDITEETPAVKAPPKKRTPQSEPEPEAPRTKRRQPIKGVPRRTACPQCT